MKLRTLRVHNFRSIPDASIEVHDFTMIVGANNAGKSNLLGALLAFYDRVKFTKDDVPKINTNNDDESWVELGFDLDATEWESLADKYKQSSSKRLTVRRYFRSKERARSNQSNIYAIIDGEPDSDLFYGAKNVGTAKVGDVIYIPALTTPTDQMKTTGPSPLREMLSHLIRLAAADSKAFKDIEAAFEILNHEARGADGFLSRITNPLNEAIGDWGVQSDLSISPVGPDEITKSLIRPGFADSHTGDSAFGIDQFGHGFQRTFLYELIKLASESQDKKAPTKKKEFDPNFTLILFEEPEAFLHPAQQENMAFHLRRLGEGAEQQVIITSHSPIFLGKAADDLGQIVRIHRNAGASECGQVKQKELTSLFGEGRGLLQCIEEYLADPAVPAPARKRARRFVDHAPSEELALQDERFRYQLWLDSERASMFFADRVLLVEGSTEKALFNWLLANKWRDFNRHRIALVDALGKFNYHRFIALFEEFGIPYGLILDDDNDKDHHGPVNQFIRTRIGPHCLSEPKFVQNCIEAVLGLALPDRDERKPLQVLRALEHNMISDEKLDELRILFSEALGLHSVKA